MPTAESASRRVILSGQPLTFAELARTGAGSAVPVAAARARARVQAARATLEEHIRRGKAVYGTTTGVGAMKDSVWATQDIDSFNTGLIQAHHFGTGEPFPCTVVRNAIAIRANTALTGRVGCSTELVDALLALLRADVIPVVRRTGSIGCADIGLMAQIGAVLTGTGEARYRGRRMPAAQALTAAGLEPLRMRPRDSLAAIAVNAVSFAATVGVLRDAAQAMRVLLATGLATADALGASRDPWKAVAYVGTEHEADIGAWLSEGARRVGWTEMTHVQDPLSLRMMPQVFGTGFQSLMFAGRVVLAATGRTDDNPVVVGGEVLTSGGSLPLDVTLYLQSVQLALAHAARNSFNRCVLLGNGVRADLPINLVSTDRPATGFGPVIKLAGELFARAVSLSHPVSHQSLVTAGGLEDEAAFLPLVVERMERQVHALHRLAALEAILSAQAFDLLGHHDRQGVPGFVHERTRRHVDFYDTDRALSQEVEAMEAELLAPSTLRALIDLAPLPAVDGFFALAPVPAGRQEDMV